MKEWLILTGAEEEALSSTISTLDELKLTTLFPVDILGRGFTYYYENWIQNLKIETEAIHGQVEGSALYNVYLQQRGAALVASCDCPYAGKCKHIAAVLIATMHNLQAEK